MRTTQSYPFHDKDVMDPAVYEEHGHPQSVFKWLRANDPLRLVSPEGFQPFWVVTKHADIVEIEKQPGILKNGPRPMLLSETTVPETNSELLAAVLEILKDSPKLLKVLATSNNQELVRSLSYMDPPVHTSYRHLAFGTGPHQCLGLILARLEMRVFFQQLIPRIEETELVGTPKRIRASFVHGLKHMNIRYRLS